jgi:L-asparaginase / beta-aspartyl-peptidase
MPATSRLTAGRRLRLSLLSCAAVAACAPVAPPPASAPVPPASARAESATIAWGLVVHGGAGSRTPPNWNAAAREIRERAISSALNAGHAILAAGGSSLDAVQAAVVLLEDDPNFNAGRGAVFTADGRNELDAAIMDGSTLNVGAVAGLHHVKNPIILARAVMDRSRHVMMIGDGAERFAREVGIELVDSSYFFTQARWDALQRARQTEQRGVPATMPRPGTSNATGDGYLGTVGAVAIDRQGRLAAATSTGGITNKRYGRVGDVPVIGAGTYANQRCAVSATGEGEWFIRYTVARDICARIEQGMTPAASADAILFGIFDPIPVDGGVIVIDARGNLAMSFNSATMPRGWIGPDGRPTVLLTR